MRVWRKDLDASDARWPPSLLIHYILSICALLIGVYAQYTFGFCIPSRNATCADAECFVCTMGTRTSVLNVVEDAFLP